MATSIGRFDRGVEAIRGDRVHGASHLAQAAVHALVAAVEAAPPGDAEAVCRRAVRHLARVRPGMAPIKNAARAFLRRLEQAHFDSKQASAIGDALAREMAEATQRAARCAADAMPQGAAIATCSHSATVSLALALAHAQGKAPQVLVLDSDGHGQRLAHELWHWAVNVNLVGDDPEEATRGATLALVGADRLLPTGAIVNGRPTLSLAQACRSAALPFYAVCDTFKLDTVRTREPGLELVPARLVSGVFTEKGHLPTGEVRHLLA